MPPPEPLDARSLPGRPNLVRRALDAKREAARGEGDPDSEWNLMERVFQIIRRLTPDNLGTGVSEYHRKETTRALVDAELTAEDIPINGQTRGWLAEAIGIMQSNAERDARANERWTVVLSYQRGPKLGIERCVVDGNARLHIVTSMGADKVPECLQFPTVIPAHGRCVVMVPNLASIVFLPSESGKPAEEA